MMSIWMWVKDDKNKQKGGMFGPPESLVEQLGEDVEQRKWRAVQHPVWRRRVCFMDVHTQGSVDKLQTQLYIH